jgi:GxxExxY protein
MRTEVELNGITKKIIGAAILVHRALGPGLLESAYEACLAYELAQAGLYFEQQKPLPVVYKQVRLDCGYRLDFVVEESVVIELKAIDALAPIHHAQVISYLKLGGYPLGLLLNFNVKVLKEGIRRIAGDANFSVVSVSSVVK